MPSLFLSVIWPETVSLIVTVCPASRPVITLVPVNPPSVATLTLNVWSQLPPPPEGWVAWNVAGPVVVGTVWQVVAALAEPAEGDRGGDRGGGHEAEDELLQGVRVLLIGGWMPESAGATATMRTGPAPGLARWRQEFCRLATAVDAGEARPTWLSDLACVRPRTPPEKQVGGGLNRLMPPPGCRTRGWPGAHWESCGTSAGSFWSGPTARCSRAGL